ncbi:MAG: tetratricopeptide repeat protein [Anaerolineales bacterium]
MNVQGPAVIIAPKLLFLTGLGDLYSEVEEFEAAIQAYEQVAEIVASDFSGLFISNYLNPRAGKSGSLT